MISLLALAGSTLLGIGIVAALTVAFSRLPIPPVDYGTPAERDARRKATYRGTP